VPFGYWLARPDCPEISGNPWGDADRRFRRNNPTTVSKQLSEREGKRERAYLDSFLIVAEEGKSDSAYLKRLA
jgi:hypothetical protein